MDVQYALRWRTDGSPGTRWFIRGIAPDGRFYGEVLDPTTRLVQGVEGVVPDWPRAREILQSLGSGTPIEPGRCFARLGRYATNLSGSEIVFEYRIGDESASAAARAFLELIQLLAPTLGEPDGRLNALSSTTTATP